MDDPATRIALLPLERNGSDGTGCVYNRYREDSQKGSPGVRRFMRIPAAVLIGVTIIAPAGLLSQPAASPPAFEVASVKPAQGILPYSGFFTYPGGRIIASWCTLKQLILVAFDVQAFQVSGGPRWINEDKFDIEAKPPGSSKSSKAAPPNPKLPPNDEQRRMLQTLLADRFQLTFHRETREGPVYLLVMGTKRLKLRDAKDKDAYPWAGSVPGGAIDGDGLAGISISMTQLAARLSGYLGRPVLDRTGLDGSFDFEYKYPSDGPDYGDVIPSIFASVQGIGLKLDAVRGPVETIVIDRAVKPSAN